MPIIVVPNVDNCTLQKYFAVAPLYFLNVCLNLVQTRAQPAHRKQTTKCNFDYLRKCKKKYVLSNYIALVSFSFISFQELYTF
jgi:hypothetical protein